jgi:hypothetical protein
MDYATLLSTSWRRIGAGLYNTAVMNYGVRKSANQLRTF